MPKKLRLIIPVTLFFLALGCFFCLRFEPMTPVLMYHSVTPDIDTNNRLQVSSDSFARQMEFLKKNNYNVIPVEELGKMIETGEKIPAKTVAITFDDGYIDNYIYAYPVLKRENLPATIFIIINEVGRFQGDRLSWDQIISMQRSGLIRIGSHTLDHPYLTQVSSEKELIRQIAGSKKILEDKLGIAINVFSYPAGRFNADIRDLVIKAGYKYAVATGLGKDFSNHDLFLIKRIRVSPKDNLFIFWVKLSGYYNSFRSHRKNG